ncbi:MAG: ABC transporter ATP-binding protein [Ignisphaera sp.]|uniref:ABC transporter ATP-binding protein n=1 Tax=Ignisphaera aggregans TaxID=334771 RepID=A0A7C4D1B0_9CREN
MYIIRLLSIVKWMGREKILDNVDLAVEAGELVVVRGRSGVGKTTLAKIISLLIKPDEGSLEFMNRDITDINESERAFLRLKYIGYIDQMFKLIPSISVADNVELPLKLLGIPRNERRKKVSDILAYLGLEDKMYRYPDELSGGEKQRIAIARALVKDPILVVGDEPISNLDDNTAHKVMEIFRKYVDEKGTAIIITTTDLYQNYNSDKDLLLVNGKLYTSHYL